MKNMNKLTLIATCLAMLPAVSGAASLGKMVSQSALGQPFRGEIEVISTQPQEAETLAVEPGAYQAYQASGLSFPAGDLGLQMHLEKKPNGKQVIVVTTGQAVNEPIFDLVVELRWSTGKLQRSYSQLLDPADIKQAPLASSSSSNSLRGHYKQGPASTTGTPPDTTANAEGGQPATAERPLLDSVGTGDEYSVKKGDSLAKIAKQYKTTDLTLQQVMLALYRNNPNAFVGKNINRLKSGKILKVPSSTEMASVGSKEASHQIVAQTREWQHYRRQLAESAGGATDTSATGKLSAKVDDQGLKKQDKQDVLRLSSADTAKAKQLEEDIAAKKKALDEANQRINDLQKNIQSMEKMQPAKK